MLSVDRVRRASEAGRQAEPERIQQREYIGDDPRIAPLAVGARDRDEPRPARDGRRDA